MSMEACCSGNSNRRTSHNQKRSLNDESSAKSTLMMLSCLILSAALVSSRLAGTGPAKKPHFGDDHQHPGIRPAGSADPDVRKTGCIRPENVTVSVIDLAHTTSARNLFPARIVEISSLGLFLRLRLDCGFPLTSCGTRESFATLGLAQGTRVYAFFKATSVHPIGKRGG